MKKCAYICFTQVLNVKLEKITAKYLAPSTTHQVCSSCGFPSERNYTAVHNGVKFMQEHSFFSPPPMFSQNFV